MTPSEAKDTLEQLCSLANANFEIAKTAQRGGKSLRGDNHYGHKFHDCSNAMAGAVTRLKPIFTRLADHAEHGNACSTITLAAETLKSFDADGATRMTAVKDMERACHEVLYPALDSMDAPAVPASEQVLPMAVVKGTRGYLEHMILQANGCYERGWYDASSIMLRKFVETLIIAIYEHDKRPQDIKNKDGNFKMLSDLISTVLNDPAFSLGRESKDTLPIVKKLGDRSAHNRHYMATKSDMLPILPGFRVLAEDLLHLAHLK